MSVPYFGDFAEDATVYIPFNTFSSDDPQASVTITNLADADLHVHKDAGLTQIATDGATITINFDGITGNHLATIDTSAHADYSTGSDYMVRMEGTTVDGGTINAWIGHFSIENRFTEADVTKWLGTAAATPTTAGVPEVDVTFVSGTAQTANDNGADINAILVDTNSLNDTKVPDTISLANINAEADTAVTDYGALKATTSLTEGYAADNSAATLEEMMYMIWSALSEFAISGTTITAKKLDGSTTSMTFTLDDGTNPTSRTRAT